ncbi:multimerin-2a isoform X1 [Hippoglossus stenolepis]|uniref:multimerin-2a isoform X1 n=1 Tax=Hippoglossus stenolepis TaxID=195615 RepID=UPI001FAFCEE4|nr:multimerin-2a isoform X1 [Hippoglossus stenolepis]
MTAVGELLLVLGLLVSAHCEVRARDPEVEEEEEELGGRAGGGGGGGMGVGGLGTFHQEATETPPLGERENLLARIGNRCKFVQKRVVTMVVVCGTEKYTIKSQSPCLSGTPDCQLVMYKLSTRPLYTQKQKVHTTLQWRCCPGHVGDNCEETVPDALLDSGGSGPTGESETERVELLTPDVQLQLGDPNREQNDHQASLGELPDASNANNQRNTTHTAQDKRQEQQYLSEAPAALSHMMALVMSQLQPLLQGFNCSLEHLSRQVGDLARDVAQLKSSQQGAELQARVLKEPRHDEAADERLEAKLDEVSEHIREVRAQMAGQRTDMENRLHSQHAMLHYNLTCFKTDIDMKLKRHQKMLQVSLQAMNATLSELKVDQDEITETLLDDQLPRPSLHPPQPPPPSDSSSLWEAIERLDNMVVNNTVKVTGLMEDMDVTSGSVQRLRMDFTQMEKLINQTARNSMILFMQTGLEVEDAKVGVLRRVEELTANLTQHSKQLQEVDVHIDYLYDALYQNHSAANCDCSGLTAAVARLDRSVANVTALANENKMALDENNEGELEQMGRASNWEPAVEAIQHDLQQVKESLVWEQSRTRTLDDTLTRLDSSLTDVQAEVSGLKEREEKLKEWKNRLSGSFNSLLKDVIRHSDVLELQLGEEVLEFLEWPFQDQEANSIPALRKQLRHLQKQLSSHNRSITSLLNSRTGSGEEVPSADQPSSSHLPPDHWPPGEMSDAGEAARERQLLLQPVGRHQELGGDGSDLWNLEKTVEELDLKVQQLEEKPCPCPTTSTQREVQPGGEDAKLQAEVTWLKRGLEEHLRVFKNVFSNADVLVGSEATLELDKLLQLVQNRDGKKENRKKGGRRKEGSGRGGDHRNKRDSFGVPVLSDQSEDSLMFVGGSPLSLADSVITFDASLNRGQFHSDSGTFTAPVGGLYLFILTLDLRPGPAHVVLQRASGGAPASLHRRAVAEAGPATGVSLLLLREGEEVRLELRGGAWVESKDNVFTGLLLQRTT